jgi:hypothetical protein
MEAAGFEEIYGVGEQSQASRSSIPLLSGKCLHVLYVVGFVDDLEPQQRFDDIFHGDEAFYAAIFIDYERDVFAAVEQALEDSGSGCRRGRPPCLGSEAETGDPVRPAPLQQQVVLETCSP